MENFIDENKLKGAMQALVINGLLNDYALERVAFGYEKPGDKIPVDLYFQDLHMTTNDVSRWRSAIPGVYIDEDERISADQDYGGYVHDMFVSQMEHIFFDAPKDVRLERNEEEIPLLPRFREYLFGLLPLFTEVLKVEVEYDAFDVIPTPMAQRSGYAKLHKFVTAILLKPLRSGGRIDRYVKDMINAPQLVRRLIEKKGRSYFLKPLDLNSHEYAFALFSLIHFINHENEKLLELKMLEWERVNLAVDRQTN